MRLERILILFVIVTFLFSTVASAEIINDSLNAQTLGEINNSSSEQLNNANPANETSGNNNNHINQTISNKTTNKLIKELKKEVQYLNQYCELINEIALAAFLDQNIQKLESEVNNSTMDKKSKKQVLQKIKELSKINNKAIKFTIKGNKKAADKQLNLEYKKLSELKELVEKKKGTSIQNATADNLLNTTNAMIQGQKNGASWIINNTEIESNSTIEYYENIESKTENIRNITKQLSDGGVPVDVMALSADEIENRNGTLCLKNTTNTTENGTVKAKAIAPVVIAIVVKGSIIVITTFAAEAIITQLHIMAIEYEIKGNDKIICEQHRYMMLAKNLESAVYLEVATLGIGLYEKTAIDLLEIWNTSSDLQREAGLTIGSPTQKAKKNIGDGCSIRKCVFFFMDMQDLKVQMEGPPIYFDNQNHTINITLFNTKLTNLTNFKVTIYQNSSVPFPNNITYTPIFEKLIDFLDKKSNMTFSFNWIPSNPGLTYLMVMGDSEGMYNESDEENNFDTELFEVNALPDLVSRLDGPENARLNKTANITAEIKNIDIGNVFPSEVTLYENTTPPGPNGTMNFTPIETKSIGGLYGTNSFLPTQNNTAQLTFNWTPTTLGKHVLKIVADSGNNLLETNETNNDNLITVNVKKEKMHLYNTEHFQSSSDPSADRAIAYYYETDEPVYLNPGARTPTFVINTTNPIFSGAGFQAWYPYGAIWLSFSNSPDGPWTSAFSNPYVYCGENTTEYEVKHWASGTGYYKYFRLYIRTQPTDWSSGILKTFITGFDTK